MNDLDEDEPTLLFSKKEVKAKLDKFYTFELSKFTTKYSFEVYFFNKIDESMCVDDECDSVEISFSAALIYNYHYQRKISFEVFENSNEP